MRTKTWCLLIGGLLILCAGLSLWLMLPGESAAYAQVWSEGKLIYTLDLRADRVVTVITDRGMNVITVRDGTIAVTEADCPDRCCMERGFCGGGPSIICLPHELEIRFLGGQGMDAAAG